ncbi:MAG TPA: hypothetical protein VIK28_02895 [Sedimentisphaerales bacterium]
MQIAFLDRLVADFDVFGLRFQHWMPAVALMLAIFVVSFWLDRRSVRK